MILKKPYAFLIKRFRIIHLILSFLIGVIIAKNIAIMNFFISYVKNNYKSNIILGLTATYTPFYLFLFVVLIILLSVAIYYLLVYKKKPNKFYLLLIIYYIIFFVFLLYVKSSLGSLSTELISARTARSVRDFSRILLFPQLGFVIFSLIRTFGFDIKKFDFQSDLKELEAGFEDNEEVELNINFEGYKTKRKVRRSFREFIYYLKENKLFVIIFLAIFAISFGTYIIKNRKVNYDKSYKTGKMFTYEGVQMMIQDSIITNLDYRGNVITDGKYYVVLMLKVSNTSGATKNIDFNNFKLKYGSNLVNPELRLSDRFTDFAPKSDSTVFSHRTEKTFVVPYEIKSSDIHRGFKIEIFNGSVYRNGKYLSKHVYLKIRPKIISRTIFEGNYTIGDKIELKDTYLKDSYITIKSYEINKSYYYSYESCYNDNCDVYDDVITVPMTSARHNNYILTLHVDYNIDDTTMYGISNPLLSTFADNFMQIVYRVNDEIYDTAYINVTPVTSQKFMAFEVNKKINNANVIQAIINIRNHRYIVNLKS